MNNRSVVRDYALPVVADVEGLCSGLELDLVVSPITGKLLLCVWDLDKEKQHADVLLSDDELASDKYKDETFLRERIQGIVTKVKELG